MTTSCVQSCEYKANQDKNYQRQVNLNNDLDEKINLWIVDIQFYFFF